MSAYLDQWGANLTVQDQPGHPGERRNRAQREAKDRRRHDSNLELGVRPRNPECSTFQGGRAFRYPAIRPMRFSTRHGLSLSPAHVLQLAAR